MVFLSAIIVALDLWHSFLARLNPEDQKKKTYLSVLTCLGWRVFYIYHRSDVWILENLSKVRRASSR